MRAPRPSAPTESARQQAKVQPSSRDPIERWLDVFTGLLAVSAQQRERIRDELEDHLRMRVEDLLILGESEPEAVQQAVKELGETAELAKRFKEATHQPRRSTIMHSILLAVAGMGLAVGAVTLTGTPLVLPHSGQPAGVASGIGLPAQDEIKTLGVDLPAGPLEQTLSTVAEVTGAPMFVHWSSMELELGVDRESEVGFIPAKNLAGSKILELINASLGLEGADVIAVRTEDNLVEVASRGYFDRLETVTMDHDISAIVPYSGVLEVTGEAINLRESIQAMIEPDVWQANGGFSTIAILGSQLSVRAPERIQVQVLSFIERLVVSVRQHEAELEIAERAFTEQQRASTLRGIESLSQRRAELEVQMQALKQQIEDESRNYWNLEFQIEELGLGYASVNDPESRNEFREKIVDAKARHATSDLERDLLIDQFQRLQQAFDAIHTSIASMKR